MFIDINEVFRNKNTITSYEVIEDKLTIRLNYGDGSSENKAFNNITELNEFVDTIVDSYPILFGGANYNKENVTAYELFDKSGIYRIFLSFESSKITIDFNNEADRNELIEKLNAGGGSGGGAVDSVNGKTGVVVLVANDIKATDGKTLEAKLKNSIPMVVTYEDDTTETFDVLVV